MSEEDESCTDFDLIHDLMTDYGMVPENTLADLIAAIKESDQLDGED